MLKRRVWGVSTQLSEYFGNLRTALADQGTGGVYAWKDEVLSSALKTTVQTGFGPRGLELAEGGHALTTAPATPDARGYLVFQAAYMLMGGQLPVSFKTRALQVRVDPLERAQTLDYLRRQIKRLESEGDPHGDGGTACFGVWQDLENALERTTEPERIA